MRGAVALDRCGAQLVRPRCWAWSAPTPPWPGGPKSGGGARRTTVPGLTAACLSRALRNAWPSVNSARRCSNVSCRPAVRRAPRALEDVEKVLTGRAVSVLSVSGARADVATSGWHR